MNPADHRRLSSLSLVIYGINEIALVQALFREATDHSYRKRPNSLLELKFA